MFFVDCAGKHYNLHNLNFINVLMRFYLIIRKELRNKRLNGKYLTFPNTLFKSSTRDKQRFEEKQNCN